MDKLDTDIASEPGGQMSFLEHLDELRKRLVKCMLIVIAAFVFCFYYSSYIYSFLETPVRRALSQAERVRLAVEGIIGTETVVSISQVQEGETGRFVIDRATEIGTAVLVPGTSIAATVTRDKDGRLGLFTTEPIFTNNAIIPTGVRLPLQYIDGAAKAQPNGDERMIVTTALEPFTLYMTVAFYAAIALSLPFLLWQVWGFISPALYRHERAYVTPFIALSTASFIVGAAFAYYILFPPAVSYLLGVGQEFRLMLRATDYFEFITLIMLAMGIIFQMPAITYVLARIGIVNAGLLIRSWKISLIVILIIAAVVSPTADILNMMLFATPMMALYVLSIFIAWFFGKKRKTDAEAAADA
ncbi:MAG: twin-arginine translocase subunit TatC [Pyrinomonadaceae bacterium]